MNCTEFVARFTDYEDGTAPTTHLAAMEEHLAGCSSCRRYKAVVERGAELLRSLPTVDLPDDFEPGLQHRLFHVRDRLAAEATSSRTTGVAVLCVAMLLTVVAWSPLLRVRPPVVELAPIVVDRAPKPILRAASLGERPLELRREPDLDVGLWDDTRLYEYSEVWRRYDNMAQPMQVGLVQGR